MNRFAQLFGLVFALIGAAAGVQGTHALVQSRRARSWPAVRGHVTSARFQDTADSHTATRIYHYAYEVGGRAYSGDREHFGARIAASRAVLRYRAGDWVNVFYNPADPAHAVLRPRYLKPAHLELFAAVAFLAFGIGVIWVTGRKARAAAEVSPG